MGESAYGIYTADWAGDVNVQDWYTTDKADANSIY